MEKLEKIGIIISIFMLVGFLTYFFYSEKDAWSVISQTNSYTYSIAIVFGMLEPIMFALALRYFLKAGEVEIEYKKIQQYVWASNFIDMLISGESISGEIARITYLNIKDRIEIHKSLVPVLAQRTIGMIITTILVVTSAFFVVSYSSIISIVIYSVVIISIVSTLLLAMIWIKPASINILTKCVVYLMKNIPIKIIKQYTEKVKNISNDVINEMISYPKQKSYLLIAVCLQISSWIFIIIAEYSVFLALGINIPLTIIVLIHSLLLAVKIPIGSVEIGLPEILSSVFYVNLGIAAIIAFSATILIRLISFWLRGLVSFFAFSRLWIKH